MKRALLPLLTLFAAISTSHAQVSPTGAHHFTALGGGSGGAGAPGSASIPLELPASRKGLPVPLSIVYTGSPRVGAAGVGWDIPVSSVRESRSIMRRKPGVVDGVVPDRLVMTLGGATALMVPTATPGTFQPLAAPNDYDLVATGDGYTAFDPAGTEYVFSRMGTGLYLLTEIRDATGTDRVVVEYEVTAPECHDGSREYRVKRLRYSPEPAGLVFLFEVVVDYTTWGTGSCEGGALLDVSFAHGEQFARSQIVSGVRVQARDNVTPGGLITIREYALGYTEGEEVPRLARVDMYGEGGQAAGAPVLPVASYEYGSAIAGGAIAFQGSAAQWSVPRVAWDEDHDDSLGLSTTETETRVMYFDSWGYVPMFDVKTTKARQLVRDLTGDGVADLIVHSGGHWFLWPGYLERGSMRFDKEPQSLGSGFELAVETTRTAKDGATTFLDLPLEELVPTREVWTELIDWNGDGRLDIVDARGGSDPDHWRVLINKPSSANEYAIEWVERQVTVAEVRDYLEHDAGYSWGPEIASNDGRLPLSRSKTSSRMGKAYCFTWSGGSPSLSEGPCPSAEGDPDDLLEEVAGVAPFATITEWKVLDLNGDGYPDLAAAGRPLRRGNFEHACHVYSEYETPYAQYWCVSAPYLEFHYELDDRDKGIVAFHNRSGARFTAQTFPREPRLLGFFGNECGVETWRHGPADRYPFGWHGVETPLPERVGDTWLSCGFLDQNGDGLVEHVDASADNPLIKFENDRYEQCETGGYGVFTQRQTAGLLDVTGDGMPDRVYQKWDAGALRWVATPYNGVDFSPTELLLPGDFELSKSTGLCDSDGRSTDAAFDLDGDGRPEHVQIRDGVLWAASIVGADGVAGAPSAGRLVAERNGFGAARITEYTSAKRALRTRRDLPMPEIVVASVRVDVEDGRSLDPTYFAYGDRAMRYDPAFHRWQPTAYARTAVMAGDGVPRGDGVVVEGTVTVTEQPLPTSYATVESYALAGAVTGTYRLEGTFLPDPWPFVAADPSSDSHLAGGTTAEHAVSVLASGSPDEWTRECYPVDPWTNLFPITPWSLCTLRAAPYVERATSWNGAHAPPSPQSVETAMSVVTVDELGRPTVVFDEGDTRRTDDDTCVELTYATPVAGSRVRGAIAARRITSCGRRGRAVLAGERYEYDGLPPGSVDAGLVTATWAEVHDAATGAPIGDYQTAAVTYGPDYAQPSRVEKTRALGTADSVPVLAATDLLYDPYGYAVIRTTTSGTDVSSLTTEHRESVIPSRPTVTIAPNGERSIDYFDAFGRPTVAAVNPGDGELRVSELTYDDSVTGRSVAYRDYLDGVAPRPVSAVTHVDALGRGRYTERQLGDDYGGLRLLTGVVERDGLGREVFAADPIECASPVADCLAGEHYGTSVDFFPGGRVRGTTLGYGRLRNQRWTDASAEIYPTTYEYAYAAWQAITRVQNPVANTTGHPSEATTVVTVTSADGRVIELRREQTGTILERTRYGYDLLGNVASVIRYGDPVAATSPVLWTAGHDSRGARRWLAEPGAAVRYFEYDEWGGLYETRWVDGAWTRLDRAALDAYGRVTWRELSRTSATADPVIESTSRYFYDVHSGSELQPDGALLGRLSHVQQDGVMETFYGYDALGRHTITARVSLADELGRAFTTRQDIDLLGRLDRIHYDVPGHSDTARYRYDSADRMTAVTWETGGAATALFEALEIDARGRYRSFALGNGVTESYDYHAGGRELPRTHVIDTPATTYTRGYTHHDGAGRVVQRYDRTQPKDTWRLNLPVYTAYRYDPLDRLASVDSVKDSGFGYDPLGNALSIQQPGQAPAVLAPDAVDRDRIATVTFGTTVNELDYDAAGNVTGLGPAVYSWTKSRYSYSYDSAGRAVGALRAGGFTATFAMIQWDASGDVANVEVKAGWGGSTVLFSERRYGELVRERWVPDLGELQLERVVPGPLGDLALVRDSATDHDILYPHAEHEGTHLVTDSTGAVVQLLDYSPFGNTVTNTGNPGSFDETRVHFNYGTALKEFGVTLLGPRFYHPQLGRFLQRDPIVFDGSASAANPYAFSLNDPINYGDPTGLEPKSWWSSEKVDPVLSRLGLAIPVGPGMWELPRITGWVRHNLIRSYIAFGQTGRRPTRFEEKLIASQNPVRIIRTRSSNDPIAYVTGGADNWRAHTREGRSLGHYERGLENNLWYNPVDWASGSLGGFARKGAADLFGGSVARGAERHGLRSRIRSGIDSWTSKRPTITPSPRYTNNLPPGAFGRTLSDGSVEIALGLSPGMETVALRHEYVHHILAARGGLFVGLRRRASDWAYLNSHFLKGTEEYLAHLYATGSHRSAWDQALAHGVTRLRFFTEGGFFGGSLVGSFLLGGQLSWESE